MIHIKTMNMTTLIRYVAKSAWRHLTVLACLLAGAALQAQTTQNWDNGAGNFLWDATSLNWSGTAWADGNNASFGSTGAGTIMVSGARDLNNLNILTGVTDPAYVFTNGTLNVLADTSPAPTIWEFSGFTTFNLDSAINVAFTNALNKPFELKVDRIVGPMNINGPVTGLADTNTSEFFELTGSYASFYGDIHLTNFFFMPSIMRGVYIYSGTDVFTGSTNVSRRGLAINGNAGLYVCGGNITSDRLVVGNGSGGNYYQSNGVVTVTGPAGPISGGVPYPAGVEFGDIVTVGTITMELDGGTLTALGIGRETNYNFGSLPAIAHLNLKGGTFQCTGDWTNKFCYEGYGATNLFDVGTNVASGIYIGQSIGGGDLTNGATIDTAGFTVVQTQPFLAGAPSGGLTTYGGGTLDLRGTNTYTGATTVSNGTLQVDGSLAAGSVVEAALGGAIGGSGIINGPVTVDDGGTVSPGSGVFGLGTLTVNNDLSLDAGGGAVFRLNTANSPVTNDSLVVTGTQDITGSTLTVVNVGPVLQVGDRFTLLSQATSGFTTVNLPTGYTWDKNLATDGSIEVTAVVNPTPTNITYSVSGNQLILGWPSDQGWRLQVQTNSLATGLSTNWFDVVGATPPYTNIVNPTNPTVFYRLVNP